MRTKRIISAVLSLVFAINILATMPIQVRAASVDDLSFAIIKGEAYVTDCDRSASGELVVPNTFQDYPVTWIGSRAFSDCGALTSITIPDSVTSISDFVFWDCVALTGIVLPPSVTSIGIAAFGHCTGLTSITIPSNVTTIGNRPFEHCTGLEIILVDSGNSFYHSTDNCLIETASKTLVAGCKNSAIPSDGSVTRIGFAAFRGHRGLTNITIPDSVTSIGNSAFEDCINLTTATFGNSVTSIGEDAFNYCKRLTSITIPDSVTSMGNSVFRDCTGLANVSIGNGVTSIGEQAFCFCTSLESITIPDSVTSIGERAFGGCRSLTDVYYTGSEEQWEAISIGINNECLINATIHYNFQGSTNNQGNANGSVRFFTRWDAQKQIAYFGEFDFLGCKLTEKTDTSFLVNVDSLVGQYVWVESEPIGDGIVDSDILLCIKPVEVRTGRVSYADASQIIIEGTTYCTPANVTLPGLFEGEWVRYYLNGNELLGLEFVDGAPPDDGNNQGGTDGGEDNSNENSGDANDDVSSDNVNLGLNAEEFINKHIEYANSERFNEQVVPGFSGALDDALDDIKENGMITAYNTLDSINSILDFDLDLTDVEEYELLLAQILFSRTGVDSIDELYDEALRKNILTICDVLIDKLLPQMTSSAVQDNIKHLKELRDTLKGLSSEAADYDDILGQIMDSLSGLLDAKDSDILAACSDVCKKAGLSFASDFLLNEFDSAYETLHDVIVGMAAAEAYSNTTDAFGEMLLHMRKSIDVPSDDPRFAPYPIANKGLITYKKILELLDLKGADAFTSPDPLNTPVDLYALATAIENFYTEMESVKAGNTSVIAQNAMAAFAEASLDNLIDAELNVVVSLLDCLPVIHQFSAIKDMFDGTQFVIDTFTRIDDRAYLGTMVMRLYAIAYIHYHTVDALANTDIWGLEEAFLELSKFSKDKQFADAVRFDEAVSVYRAILSVAVSYAEEYYTTYYKIADSFLPKYPGIIPEIPPYVDTKSDIYKSVKVKIFELQLQKNDLAYEWCHSTKLAFNQLNGIHSYDSSDLLVYSFKCPVTVTFRNELGEIVAVLSNGKSTILSGYEQYFFTSEVISGSGEYVKIAAVPKTYSISIEGNDNGQMDVEVSEYAEGSIGETEQYFGIPVLKGCTGYFQPAADADTGFRLVMENNIDISSNWIVPAVCAGTVVVVLAAAVVVIVSRKKTNKKRT